MGKFGEEKSGKLQALSGAVAKVLRVTGASLPPARRTGMSMPPAVSEEWQEDDRFLNAISCVEAGYKSNALTMLEALLADKPDHAAARAMMIDLGLELGEAERVRTHASEAVLTHAVSSQHEKACELFRKIRTGQPDAAFNEKALVQVLRSGERMSDDAVIVEATRVLMNAFPNSASLPRALLATAQCQVKNSRADLARRTLSVLIERFPMDALVGVARQRLAELGGL
jgi:hypothetical protein